VATIKVEQDQEKAVYTNEDGETVTLPKRKKRNYRDDEDRETQIIEAIELLESKKIDASNNNLKAYGFGRKILKAFRDKHPKEKKMKKPFSTDPAAKAIAKTTTTATTTSKSNEELDQKHVEPEEEPAPKRAHEDVTHPLPAGTRVIIPKPKGAAAQREAKRRALELHGESGVLENEEDCKGEIVRNVKMGPKLYRDQASKNNKKRPHFLQPHNLDLTKQHTFVPQFGHLPFTL